MGLLPLRAMQNISFCAIHKIHTNEQLEPTWLKNQPTHPPSPKAILLDAVSKGNIVGFALKMHARRTRTTRWDFLLFLLLLYVLLNRPWIWHCFKASKRILQCTIKPNVVHRICPGWAYSLHKGTEAALDAIVGRRSRSDSIRKPPPNPICFICACVVHTLPFRLVKEKIHFWDFEWFPFPRDGVDCTLCTRWNETERKWRFVVDATDQTKRQVWVSMIPCSDIASSQHRVASVRQWSVSRN